MDALTIAELREARDRLRDAHPAEQRELISQVVAVSIPEFSEIIENEILPSVPVPAPELDPVTWYFGWGIMLVLAALEARDAD